VVSHGATLRAAPVSARADCVRADSQFSKNKNNHRQGWPMSEPSNTVSLGSNGANGSALLRLSGIDTFYGQIHILQGVELEVREGELVCLLGGNASGKSTTLKTILGLVRPRRGTVEFGGEDVTGRTTSYRIARGMAIVPENRRLFAPMTVLENLEMGAYLRRGRDLAEDYERVYSLFPLLRERRSQLAGTLSGGEQQMVAMGRALMARPKLLLMDEPSMGLAPILVERSFEIIRQVHEAGVAVLVVEQNANVSLSIADRGYVLQTGRVVLADTASNLLADENLRKAYLGR
jgi:branched-chain amino acid transport system ATP-binding protein